MLDYHIIISKIKLKQVAVAESRITFVNKFVNLQRIFIFTFFMLVLLCDWKAAQKDFFNVFVTQLAHLALREVIATKSVTVPKTKTATQPSYA